MAPHVNIWGWFGELPPVRVYEALKAAPPLSCRKIWLNLQKTFFLWCFCKDVSAVRTPHAGLNSTTVR
jgi:hypothetical protein